MKLTEKSITNYLAHLAADERAPATLAKYARDLRAFADFLGKAELTKDRALAYKSQIAATHAPTSVNSMLAALNGFFAYYNVGIKLKPLKFQRRSFLPEEKELSREEYHRLLAAAKTQGNERLHLALQALCATGSRVSELRFFTVEAVQIGAARVTNKRKTRTVLIPAKLKTALLRYCKKRGITSGSIFITKNGKPLDRSNIWAAMKKLCAAANVAPSKVFPHNLRHLFARVFYKIEKDLAKLADILGHGNINTTRIYTMDSGTKHRKILEKLGLVT
jgi:site-specific recombinase XerD